MDQMPHFGAKFRPQRWTMQLRCNEKMMVMVMEMVIITRVCSKHELGSPRPAPLTKMAEHLDYLDCIAVPTAHPQ